MSDQLLQPVRAVSVIDGVDIQQVENTIRKIANFQAIVQRTLKEGHDYGVIPGTHKPTLYKPGAEKVLMLLGLTSEYEIEEKIQDYDKGFFAFTLRCFLSRGDVKVTEGVGHANSRESRYTTSKSGKDRDPYSIANTVLKMAKKRAQVDAVLTVASLSEVFTQDMEDVGEDTRPSAPSRPRPASGGGMSDAQRNFALKLAAHFEKDEPKRAEWAKAKYGIDLANASKAEGSKLIEQLQADIAADKETRKQEGLL